MATDRYFLFSVIFCVLIIFISNSAGSLTNSSNQQTDVGDNSVLVVAKQTNFMDKDGAHIEGQIKNIGSNKVSFVKVLISFYGESGNLLGTQFSYTEPSVVAPKNYSIFKVVIPNTDPKIKGMSTYTINLLWQYSDGSSGYYLVNPQENNTNMASQIPSVLPQLNVAPQTVAPQTESNRTETKIASNQLSKITYLGTIGSEGSTEGKFFSPASIEYSSSNKKIYVSDLDNNRIQIFDTNGHFISSWGAPKYQFAHPEDVATDADGFVYIPEVENNRIQKFDSVGNFVTKWGSLGIKEGQFNHPGDVAIDSQNKLLFVTDIGNSRIQKFDLEGKFISSWGTLGKGEGQFNRPAGITYDEAKQVVYVADTKNNRIQKFDINGKFLGKWESFSFGTPNQKFDRPDGIKYDEFSGFIFVADRKNNKIVVFEEDGKPIYELDLLKATKGLVIKPRDVTLDETGKLFVVDKVNSKIHVFGTKSLP